MSLPRAGDVLPVVLKAAFGADLTADPTTWTWTDISTRMLRQATITRGRQDETSQTQPSQLQISLKNTDGWLTPGFPGSPWYKQWDVGTPVQLQVTVNGTTYTRFQGRVQVTSPVWPSGNSDVAEVAVTAKGLLYHLGLPNTPAASPLKMAVLADSPVAYWPGEDGSKSSQIAAAAGGQPMTVSGDAPSFGSGGPAGSAPLVTFGAATAVTGPVTMAVSTQTWTVEFYVKIPSAPAAGATPVVQWQTLGTLAQWRFTVFPSTTQLGMEVWDRAGNQVSNLKVSYTTPTPYATDLFISVAARQNGAAVQYEWIAHTPTGNWNSTSGSIASSTMGPVISVQVPPADATATWDRTGWTLGHFAVWDSVQDPVWGTLGFIHYIYMTGNPGEAPLNRISSVTGQLGISFTARGSSAEKSMGARPIATGLAVMREAELVDLGILTDGLDAGLNYLPGSDRYNLAVAMALDTNQHQVKLPFDPAADDQRLQTKVTASRSSGSSATYTDPLVTTKGEYPASVTVNLADDSTLYQQAAWRAHLATVAEMRVPTISLNLRDNSELLTSWLAMDIGSRYTVANPPIQYPPGGLDQVLEQYTETIDAVTWLATMTGSAYAPWHVFVLDTDRLDSDASTLHSAVAAGATSLSVDTTAGYPLWTTSGGTFDLSVGGYQVTCTAISGAASPQTFTVNRMPAAVAAGAQVSLWKPAVLAL